MLLLGLISDNADAISAVSSMLTAFFALGALVVAGCALRASNRTAKAAVDALEADVIPMLAYQRIRPADTGEDHFFVVLRNVGNGPALNVRVAAASYFDQGILALRRDFFEGDHLVPIAAGESADVRLVRFNRRDLELPPVIELLACYRDIAGVERYSHVRPGIGPQAFSTTVGKQPAGAAGEFLGLFAMKRAEYERDARAAGRF